MPDSRFLVRAISQMENRVATATDDLDDAVRTAERLTAASPHKTFWYEVWDTSGPVMVWPAEVVVA